MEIPLMTKPIFPLQDMIQGELQEEEPPQKRDKVLLMEPLLDSNQY